MVRTDPVSHTVAVFVISHKNKIFSESCKKTACFVGSIYEGICAGFMKLKNLEKHLYFCPFWMPTT